MQQRVDLVRSWEQAAFAQDERIKLVEVFLQDSAKVVLIVRPDGRLFEDWRPMTAAYLRCTAEDKGVRESATYNVAGRAGLEYFDP